MASSSRASSSRASSSGASSSRREEAPGPSKKKRKVVTRYPAFKAAIEKVFKRWSALKIAVEQGQGGPRGNEIAAWMESVTEDFFYENDDLMGEEVEYFLGSIMNQEFNTIVKDNSLEDMGDELCSYFRLCENKKEDELLKILENLNMTAPSSIKCMSRSTVDDSSEEGSNEEGSNEDGSNEEDSDEDEEN